MSDETKLSPSQTVRGLRTFLFTGIFWGAWARASGLGTAIFTGYVLWLGGTATDIAFLTSLAYLTSLWQVFALRLTSRVKNKKALISACGVLEVAFRFSVIAIPLFLYKGAHSIIALYVLVTIGLSFGYTCSPIFNDWMATTIPENIRAKFTSQRTLASSITAFFAAYLFGKFIDFYPERYGGFAWVFLIGLAAGAIGYLILLRAPMLDVHKESNESILKALSNILRNQEFVRLLTFTLLFQFSIGISNAFYTVFMIQNLKLSYTTIAIYSNFALIATMLSYRPLGGLVDRFGSKPVMQMLLIPGALGQLLRVFTSADSHYLFPVSMVLFALMHAGIAIAMSPLLYSLLPQRGTRASYFAAWSTMVNLFAAVAPMIGGILANRLSGFQEIWFGYPIGNLQMVFLVTSAFLVLLWPVLRRVEERKAQSVGWLISQVWRGNPISYLYNLVAITHFGGEALRAKATTGIARSGSPMAADELIKALDDLSPDVRKKAAEGLGDLRTEDAVAPLMDRIADRNSDIRAEAAEALGKIRHPLGVDVLVDALDDDDTRVRISAIRALGDSGSEGVRVLLLDRLTGDFDRQTFPTLVDTLSHMGEPQVVRIALERMPNYESPIIRAQLLNSICHCLGAEDLYYRLAILDVLGQARRLGSTLQKASRELDSIRQNLPHIYPILAEVMKEIHSSFDDGEYETAYVKMVEMVNQVGEQMMHFKASSESGEYYALTRGAAGALLTFDQIRTTEIIGEEELIFATICLYLSINALKNVQMAD